MTKAPRLSAHEIRRVAVEAVTDTRTVLRYVNDLPMKSTTAERVRAALVRLNLTDRVVGEPTP